MDDLPGQAHPDGTAIEPLLAGPEIEHIRRSMGYRLHERSGTRVRATLSLDAAHHQHFGRVHGGIYAIAVEGVASEGACATVADRGMYAVGTSNTTDFLRPVDVDQLEVVAEPLFQGRTSRSGRSRSVATGTASSWRGGSCACRTFRCPTTAGRVPTRGEPGISSTYAAEVRHPVRVLIGRRTTRDRGRHRRGPCRDRCGRR